MLVYLELIFTAIFWGGTFVAGRIVALEAPPFTAAFLRFLTASLCLLAINWRSYGGRLSLPERPLLISLILLGLTGVFSYNVFFFLGLERIEASRASLIIATKPVFIVLFNALIFRDRLYPLAGVGILLSLTGAGIVITRGDMVHALKGGVGLGELFMFGCVLSWSAYSLIGKSVLGMAALAPPACMEGLFSEPNPFRPRLDGHFVPGHLRYRGGICALLSGDSRDRSGPGEPVHQPGPGKRHFDGRSDPGRTPHPIAHGGGDPGADRHYTDECRLDAGGEAVGRLPGLWPHPAGLWKSPLPRRKKSPQWIADSIPYIFHAAYCIRLRGQPQNSGTG